ncbi:hypothetical protein D030_4703B, partial [Vibrio parahaemolyticus AQ3810]
DFVLTALMFGN